MNGLLWATGGRKHDSDWLKRKFIVSYNWKIQMQFPYFKHSLIQPNNSQVLGCLPLTTSCVTSVPCSTQMCSESTIFSSSRPKSKKQSASSGTQLLTWVLCSYLSQLPLAKRMWCSDCLRPKKFVLCLSEDKGIVLVKHMDQTGCGKVNLSMKSGSCFLKDGE